MPTGIYERKLRPPLERFLDLFAWWPTWTIQGWVLWTDVVEIHTFTFEGGWKTHREKLRGR